MKNQLRFFISVVVFSLALLATPVFAAEYHVATNGSSSGNGSSGSPWSLQYALNGAGGRVQGGDTIWVHGGTYTGQFVSTLNGNGNQIVVRNYNGERATIDGGTNQGTTQDVAATLLINGGYTTFWGLEVMTSATDRLASAGGWPDKTGTPNTSHPYPWDFNRGDGVQFSNSGTVPGVKIVNMIIHDNRQGISVWAGSTGAEIYGNLVYNDGWQSTDRGHGHGLYAQNSSNGARRTVSDNIFWGQFSHGAQVYGSGDAFIDNYSFIGNVSFGHQMNERGLLVGGPVAHNEIFDSNMVYNDQVQLGQYFGLVNASAKDNYLVSNTSITAFRIQSTPCSNFDSFINNTIFGNIDSSFCNPSNFSGNNINGTRPSSAQVFVRKNKYEDGRANITVFNWPGSSSVTADISSLGLSTGTYQLHNAENYYGDITTINYSGGGTISINMNKDAHSRAPLIGYQQWSFTTFPDFGSFILTKVGGGGPGGDTTPPSTPATPSSSNVTQTSATISWNASSDSSGISRYNVYRNGALIASPTGTTYTNTGLTANTTYSYTVSAVDASSNSNQSPQSSPARSVTTLPATQTTYTLSVTKSGTGTGTVMGTGISCGTDCSEVVNSGSSVILSATPLANSTFSGWSGGGCSGTGSSCTVNNITLNTNVDAVFKLIDNVSPLISMTTPANGATVSGTTVTISANASDNVGVVGVQFLLDGVSFGSEDTISPYSTSWNTTGIANGTHTLSARARDAAGNTTVASSVTVTVNNTIVDKVSPVVSFSIGTPSSLTVPITNFIATDNIGVTGYLLNESSSIPSSSSNWSNSPPYSYTFGSTGPKTLYAWAKDAAGNVSSGVSRSVTITPVVDTGCTNPPPIPGTASPCPVLSLSQTTISKATPLTITLTPGGEKYLYKTIYVSKGTSSCTGTDWCSFDLGSPYVYSDWKQTSSPVSVTIPANTLSVGTHYILGWDWTASSPTCFVGAGSTSCGGGTWRLQKVDVTN